MIKCLDNNVNIIIFVGSIKKNLIMLNSEMKREKKLLEKDLLFFLNYYKEVTTRSIQMKTYFDNQIEIIIEKLKEIGH